MKLTNKFKKFFALFFVLIVVIPLTSSFGVWENLAEAEDAYATGNSADSSVANGFTTTTSSTYAGITYEFKMNEDKDIYDHDVSWQFGYSDFDDSDEDNLFEGVFTANFKTDVDNEKLTIQELGTPENPYVILEVTPDSSISPLRPHIGDMGYYDLTAQEVADIELTEDEVNTIKLQALYSFDYSGYSKKYVKTRTAELRKALEEALAKYDKITVTVTENNCDTVLDERLVEINDRISALIAKSQSIAERFNASYEMWTYTQQYQAAGIPWELVFIKYCQDVVDGVVPGYSGEEYAEAMQNAQALVDEYNALTAEKEQIALAKVDLAPILTELSQLKTFQFDFITYLNSERVNNEIDVIIKKLEEIVFTYDIMSEEEYTKYINIRLADALYYKKKYEQTLIYYPMLNNQQYTYSYEYVMQYDVDAYGNFKTFNAGDTKTIISLAPLTDVNGNPVGNTVSALHGEYQITNEVMNPLSMNAQNGKFFNDGRYLIEHNNTFVKSCLDMAYNSTLENGVVQSQEAYIDEYIFTGWSIMDGGTLVSVESLPDDYDLSGITELYTNWVIRKYEETEFQVLATESTTQVEFTSSTGASYIVHVPSCVASANSMGVHDVRNQLTMCTVDSQPRLLAEEEFKNFSSTGMKHYVLNTSAWDFDFSKTLYPTAGSLKKVAPKLMADTDYYVLTRNQVVTANKVTYYPYNVLVITITPDELNKMVYFDTSVDTYSESARLNKFLGDVDFIFFSNGGESYYKASTYSNIKANDLVFFTEDNRSRLPVVDRAPLMYEKDASGKPVFAEDKINYIMSYGSNFESIPDIEWQVADKVYKRVAIPRYTNIEEKTQTRSMVVIFDESLGDPVSGRAGATANIMNSNGEYISGTECNLAKLILMFFSFKDSGDFYDYYVNENYSIMGAGNKEIKLDKISGVHRTTGDETVTTASGEEVTLFNSSYFTGELYEYEKWNTALFLPYEVMGRDHYKALSTDPVCGGFKPENGQLGKTFFEAFGLAPYTVYKNIGNPYAYTYNGDTSLTQNFFKYTIDEISNPTNGYSDASAGMIILKTPGNTELAFDYFRRVRPCEIRNDRIAPKSCIEYMVQNAQMGYVDTNDRKITILNKIDQPTRMKSPAGSVYVDTIIVDDFSQLTNYIDYKFESPTSDGFFVPEILWTERYYDYDNNNDGGLMWYLMHTNQDSVTSGTLEEEDMWYHMPDDLDNENKEDYYMTRILKYVTKEGSEVAEPDRNGAITSYSFQEGDKTTDTGINYINKETEYYAEVFLKPIIEEKTWDQRTYIVAVKQYSSYTAYKAGMLPECIILKNVMLEKLTHLFNLD